MPTLKENLKKLNEWATWTENWDGYGAPSIPEKVTQRARELNQLEPLKSSNVLLYPTARRSVQFEHCWGDDDIYVEVEVLEDSYEILVERSPKGEDEFQEFIETDINNVIRILWDVFNEKVKSYRALTRDKRKVG